MELETEEDGRWIAEVLELPGTLAYGTTREDALASAQALALQIASCEAVFDAVHDYERKLEWVHWGVTGGLQWSKA